MCFDDASAQGAWQKQRLRQRIALFWASFQICFTFFNCHKDLFCLSNHWNVSKTLGNLGCNGGLLISLYIQSTPLIWLPCYLIAILSINTGCGNNPKKSYLRQIFRNRAPILNIVSWECRFEVYTKNGIVFFQVAFSIFSKPSTFWAKTNWLWRHTVGWMALSLSRSSLRLFPDGTNYVPKIHVNNWCLAYQTHFLQFMRKAVDLFVLRTF